MFCYWADSAPGAEFCRLHNEAIAAVVAARPTRFLGAAIVPLQAPDLAVKELERVARLGFGCVEIGSSVDGRDLDDEALHPVWEAARGPTSPSSFTPRRPCAQGRAVPAYNLPLVLANPWRPR
jgi:aminocarboxymuconate-semialdehyde decarboxylase